MKIEAGKYYLTRDGRKAFVGAIVQPGLGNQSDRPIKGFVEGFEFEYSWWINGTFNGPGGGESESDLISEWHEPITGYVNVYRDDDAAWLDRPYDCRRAADHSALGSANRIACVKFTEGQFDD